MSTNPFTIYTYKGPDHFCDRNTELSRLLEMFDNQRYTLLYSMRRLGKTGLVHHFHNSLRKRKKTVCVYCDVQNTKSDGEFVTKLISAVVSAIETSQDRITSRIGRFFSSLRPVLTFDPVTHAPSLQLNIETAKEVEVSLNILMKMLGELPGSVQIALDEFQQIATYEQETVIDATLRGYLGKIPNVHFLFCGSQRHLLLGLFSDARKPFFGTVEQMQLQLLDPQIYQEFIVRHFEAGDREINEEAVSEILEWTRGHTFYTQYFCNKLYAKGFETIGLYEVEHVKNEILFSFEPSYLTLQSVLSNNQFKLLKGISIEGSVTGVSSSTFLSRHGLAQSSALQSLKVLLSKELLYEELNPKGSRFLVYDPFFSRWLERR